MREMPLTIWCTLYSRSLGYAVVIGYAARLLVHMLDALQDRLDHRGERVAGVRQVAVLQLTDTVQAVGRVSGYLILWTVHVGALLPKRNAPA